MPTTTAAASPKKVRALAAAGAQLVVLQELHDTPLLCQTEDVDLCDLAASIPDGAPARFYSDLAREAGTVLVSSLFERRAPGLYHNTAVVYDTDGLRGGKYRKMHIPDDPAYYEKFYFTPGDLGFRPSTPRWDASACSSAGTNGIPRPHASWPSPEPKSSSTPRP